MQGFECRVLRATGGFFVRHVIRGGAGIVNDGCEAREGRGAAAAADGSSSSMTMPLGRGILTIPPVVHGADLPGPVAECDDCSTCE
ncbi:hypothetical protein GQ85_04270 [Rhodococcus rhodochrous]|nr:hypothetical protein GQ85_04270 [Rhodococcus rhodochrous]